MPDLVLVGVYSGLRQNRKQLTGRVSTALKNPYVHVLAHPTGRILLEREEGDLDWDDVFRACQENHKILENKFFSGSFGFTGPLSADRRKKRSENDDRHRRP